MSEHGPDQASRSEETSDEHGFLPGHAEALIRRERCAVVMADVAGYTSLMERNEEDTHLRLSRLRQGLLDPCIRRYGGRTIKNTGDGFIAVFSDATCAARCSIFIQIESLKIASRLPAEERILLRLGINFCDVIADGDDIFGEGVNITARVMALAEPGDIVMTSVAAEAAEYTYRALPRFETGALHLKNVSKPIRAVGIRIGSAGQARAPKLLGVAEPRPSIAILPFRTVTDSETENLASRIVVAEITHALSSIKDLFVIAQASALSPYLHGLNPSEIGKQLAVDYILQGEVSAEAGRMTIFTHVTATTTGQIIGSERHEAAISELFELRTEIAISATRSIAPYIRAWELQRAARKHSENLTAYDLVLQAQQQLYRLEQNSYASARTLLQQAIALDSSYGPAHSLLAYWYIFRVGEWLSLNPEADAVEAARSARTAIELDERDALARAIYGHVQSFLFRDYEGALPHFERAIRDGPNCPEAWSMSSVTLGFLGDGKTAVDHATYGLQLSPLDAHIFYKESSVAQAHYVDEDYEAAVAWARRAQSHNPAALFNDRVLVASLVALGRCKEAQRVAHAMLERTPDFRLGIYRRRCPFRGNALEVWIERLREAGIPE